MTCTSHLQQTKIAIYGDVSSGSTPDIQPTMRDSLMVEHVANNVTRMSH